MEPVGRLGKKLDENGRRCWFSYHFPSFIMVPVVLDLLGRFPSPHRFIQMVAVMQAQTKKPSAFNSKVLEIMQDMQCFLINCLI